MSTWGSRMQAHWRHGWRLARQGGERVQRLAAQGGQKAREAGVNMARKVIGVQRSAGLEEFRAGWKMMQRSAAAAVGEREGRMPDAGWRAGYAATAEAEGILADPWAEAGTDDQAEAGEPGGQAAAELEAQADDPDLEAAQ
jgi:hypothetical protein